MIPQKQLERLKLRLTAEELGRLFEESEYENFDSYLAVVIIFKKTF